MTWVESSEKFLSVIKALQTELPSCELGLQDLEECLMQVHWKFESLFLPFLGTPLRCSRQPMT